MWSPHHPKFTETQRFISSQKINGANSNPGDHLDLEGKWNSGIIQVSTDVFNTWRTEESSRLILSHQVSTEWWPVTKRFSTGNQRLNCKSKISRKPIDYFKKELNWREKTANEEIENVNNQNDLVLNKTSKNTLLEFVIKKTPSYYLLFSSCGFLKAAILFEKLIFLHNCIFCFWLRKQSL